MTRRVPIPASLTAGILFSKQCARQSEGYRIKNKTGFFAFFEKRLISEKNHPAVCHEGASGIA